MLSDWKWSTVGSPTFDLATLMLSATPSKEFRDAYVKPLLQTYHRVFTGALSSRYGLEYPSFTCEDLVKDYEMSLHGAFLKVSRIDYVCLAKFDFIRLSLFVFSIDDPKQNATLLLTTPG